MKDILTQTQEAFRCWRLQGHRRYGDQSLKEQAIKCLDLYTQKQVSQAIGVTIATLRAWRVSGNISTAKSVSNSGFISVTLPDIHETSKINLKLLSFRLTLPNGIAVSIEQQDFESSVGFIRALSKEFNKCST